MSERASSPWNTTIMAFHTLLDSQTLVVVFLAFSLFWVLRILLQFRQAAASVSNHPGHRTFIDQNTFLSNVLPEIPGVTPGRNHTWRGNFKIFKHYGWDIHTSVAVYPKVTPTIHLASATAIKEVTTNRVKWPKPLEFYDVLNFYGRNIVSTEGDEWKKNRKITAPAFTDRNNRIVWDYTLDIMKDLFDNVWGNQDSITIDHAPDLTMPLTLFVISSAGFGRHINFTSSDAPPAGHTMTFKEAIHHVASNVLVRLVAPKFYWHLTSKLRTVDRAFKELDKYLLEMIDARRTATVKEERYDLLSGLLDANEEESKDGESKLTQDELTGNIFIFLIAGHETSGNTLAWAFLMLALYPDEQEKLYKHVKANMPGGRWPSYEDMPRLSHSLAVMYETLRLFPAVPGIPKTASEDTFLTATNALTGEKKAVPVPKDTMVVISVPGLHHNTEYWDNPEEFRPERFLKPDWPRDAFLPFNGGPRACLGRKFSETEVVAALSVVVERYSIHVKEEPRFANETFEERKNRLLTAVPGLTHTPVRVPLTFKRRY